MLFMMSRPYLLLMVELLSGATRAKGVVSHRNPDNVFGKSFCCKKVTKAQHLGVNRFAVSFLCEG